MISSSPESSVLAASCAMAAPELSARAQAVASRRELPRRMRGRRVVANVRREFAICFFEYIVFLPHELKPWSRPMPLVAKQRLPH